MKLLLFEVEADIRRGSEFATPYILRCNSGGKGGNDENEVSNGSFVPPTPALKIDIFALFAIHPEIIAANSNGIWEISRWPSVGLNSAVKRCVRGFFATVGPADNATHRRIHSVVRPGCKAKIVLIEDWHGDGASLVEMHRRNKPTRASFLILHPRQRELALCMQLGNQQS